MLLSSDADKLREARCATRGRASAVVGGKRLEYHDVNRQSLDMKSHDVPRTCSVIPSRIAPVVPLDSHGTTNRVALPIGPTRKVWATLQYSLSRTLRSQSLQVGTTGVYTPTCKTITATTTCGSIWFLGQRRFRIVCIPIRRGETAQLMLTAEIHCALRLYIDAQGEDRRGSRADQLAKRA